MARIGSFLLEDISGKVGDKVYYQRNGKTFVRSLTLKKQLRVTLPQQMQRQRFARMMKFCQMFRHSVIPLIWNGVAKSNSGFGLFMKTNAPAFGKEGELMDPRLIRLSTGKLTIPKGLTVRRAEADPNRIEVSWDRDPHLGGVPLWDELMAVSMAHEQYSDVLATGITRGDLGGSFHLPALNAPPTHLYCFFASDDKSKYSESVCFEI